MSWNPTHLQVAVQRARNLIAKGKSGTNDVFVTVSLGKEKFHTTTKEKAADPEWYEECDMILPDKYEESRIEIVVSHRNALGMDEFLGRLELPQRNYNIHDPPKSQWYALLPKPGHTKNFKRGELEIRLCYIVAKLKDPDSISTASSASKRLKIGKKMLSSLGEKLHMKKKDKIRDHIPDLTGLDEGVLDDDDIAENYSTAVKFSRKTSDSSSHQDEKPSSSVPPFTKFTPFPKEKTDTRKSPSSSIASEEDLAHKHGDAGSENSLEMGHEKPARGLTRLSGGKPKKLSLGKRGLISKDKSQSVWEISNTKSEFGLAAGLRLTAHSSKEEGDTVGSKRPLVVAAKDLENVTDVPSRAEDRISSSQIHSAMAHGKVGSPNTGSLTTSSAWPSAAVHEPMTQLGGTHKIGMAKSELKQTPVLVDDDDDSDYQHSANSASPPVASSAVDVKKDTKVALSSLSYDSSRTVADNGHGLARANEARAPAVPNVNRKDAAILDASGSSIIESISTGVPITMASHSSPVVPSAPVTAVVAAVPDSISSNPFSSASADGPKKASKNGNTLGIEDSLSTNKPRRANPFEDSDTYSAAEHAGGNPFEEDGDTTGNELTNNLASNRFKDTQKAFNPFEESVEGGKAENSNGSHSVEPLQHRALDPPAIETVTISSENDIAMKMVVTESATKAVKTSSRKVIAPTAPLAFRMPPQAIANADRGPTAVAAAAGGDAAAPSATTVTSPAGDTGTLSPATKYSNITAVAVSSRSPLDTRSTAVSGSLPTTNVSSGPVVKAGSNNNPFEEDNEDDHQAKEYAAIVPITLADNLSIALPPVGTTSSSDSANIKTRLTSASASKKVTAPPPSASEIATAAIASARAVQAPAEKPQAAHVRASPEASPKVLHSSATIGEAAIGRAALPHPPTASAVEAIPTAHLVDTISGKSTTEKLHENSRRGLGADAGFAANNTFGDGASERSTVSSKVEKITVGTSKPAANNVGSSTLVGVSSSKNLEPAAIGKQAALSSNTTSAKGHTQDSVIYGHSLTSAATFKDESTSTSVPADTTVDSATQTQTFESQDNIPPEFKGISKELLVEMVLKMKAQLAAKEGQVRDLEEYIDSLLVRVMDGNPSLLLHTDMSMKRTSGKP